MGSLVEGSVNSGTIQPNVSHSPAVSRTNADTVYGTNNYANRVDNYYARDIYMGGPRRRPYPYHHGHHRHMYDRFDRFASKSYEKAPPPNRTGEVLNLMKTDQSLVSALRSAASGKGFLGFSGKLNPQEVANIAQGHLSKHGYNAGEIANASKILVEGERGKVNNQSAWAWALGVPLAIIGGILGVKLGGKWAKTTVDKASALATGGARKMMGMNVPAVPITTSLTTGEAITAATVGAATLGGGSALIAGALDQHGDGRLSSQDIDQMSTDQHASILDRHQAGRYYRDIHRTGHHHGHGHYRDGHHHRRSGYSDFHPSP